MEAAAAVVELAQLCRALAAAGLVGGRAGNASVRWDGGLVVTPTGQSLADLRPSQLAVVDSLGRVLGGDPPSSELSLHALLYGARPDAGAVVHLHSPALVALALRGRRWRPAEGEAAARFGTVPVVLRRPAGSAALAAATAQAAGGKPPPALLLLRGHGAVLLAPTAAAAHLDAVAAERAALVDLYRALWQVVDRHG